MRRAKICGSIVRAYYRRVEGKRQGPAPIRSVILGVAMGMTNRIAARWLTPRVLSAVMVALPLAACDKGAIAVNAATTVVAPLDPLPPTTAQDASTSAVAPIPLARLVDRGQTYAYLDTAAAMRDAFGASPPDYAFSYQDSQPFIWRSADSAMEIAEPAADGDRAYFFRSGTELPYLVSNGLDSYGYDGDALVAVYDPQGSTLTAAQIDQQRPLAALYLQRGHDLYMASWDAPHLAVGNDQWLARRGDLAQAQARWDRNEAQNAGWRSYHLSHVRAEDDRWAAERLLRQASVEARQKSEAAQLAADMAQAQMLAEAQQVVAQSQARLQAKALAMVQARERDQAVAQSQGKSQALTQARAQARAQALLGPRARREAQAQTLWEAEAQARAQAKTGGSPNP
jgi:hypothetical protein